jgi:outer membrane protein OmpA-like peptidoglycan-associated protein
MAAPSGYRFNPAKLVRLLLLPLVIVGGVLAWRYFDARQDDGDGTTASQPATTEPRATEIAGSSAPSTPGGGGRPSTQTPAASPGRTSTPARTPTASTRGPNVVVAYDSFPSYHTWAYAAKKNYGTGINLVALGFGLEEDNPSEDEKFARLRSGRYHALITTLDSCALQCDDSMLVPFVLDESAGADEWYVRDSIRTFNDLAGKRVCFTERTVSHALYVAIGSSLDLLGRMQAVPLPDVNAALDAFNGNRCDSVIAWVPNTEEKLYNGANLRPGVRKLTDTSRFRFVLDVPILNRKWATENETQAQALVDAYFRGLKDVQENPENVAAFMVETYKSVKSADGRTTWTDWSGIEKREDLRGQLGSIAQATLGQNRLAMNDPGVLAGRIAEFRGYWNRAGVQGSGTDPARLVDNRWLLKASDNQALGANTPPVNASFALASKITMPRLTEAETGRAQEVAKLPVEKISFQPDRFEIQPVSQRSLLEIAELLRRTPGLYLFIEGRAAKPAGAPPQETITVAEQRANAVANFLAAQPGIDVNRLVILYPKTDAELREKLRYYNAFREEELEQDRLVLFTLRQAGGQ